MSSLLFLCLCLSVLTSEVSPTPLNRSGSVSEEGLRHDFPLFLNKMRQCQNHYGVPLHLENYGIIHNPKEPKSSVLHPRIYVPKKVAKLEHAQLMVRDNVLEALWVASQYETFLTSIAVIPYARVTFTKTQPFLNKTYLEVVLGESAALGVDGIILWGQRKFANSTHQCLLLRAYIDDVLGVYVVQLRDGVQRCSQVLCGGHGRCARQQPHSDDMIPLDEDMPDLALLRKTFKCMCACGWSGEACEKRDKSDTH